jgi:hypothetical protein
MTFTKDDLKRTLWTFVQAGLAAAVVVLSAQSQIPSTWDGLKQTSYAAGVAFIAAAIAAAKNLLLSDTNRLK